MKRKKSVDALAVAELPDVAPRAHESVVRIASAASQVEYNSVPMMVLSLDEAADILSDSRFMRPTFVNWIKDSLRAGNVHIMERNGEPHVSYRLANKQDIMDCASEGVRQSTVKKATAAHVTGTGPVPPPAPGASAPPPSNETRPRRAPSARKVTKAGTVFVFTLPPAGPKREARFAADWVSPTSGKKFSAQARAVIEIIAESGETELNQDALTHILETGAAAKGLEAASIYRRFFRFAFTPGYELYDGLVIKK